MEIKLKEPIGEANSKAIISIGILGIILLMGIGIGLGWGIWVMPERELYDLNNDGVINEIDLSILMAKIVK